MKWSICCFILLSCCFAQAQSQDALKRLNQYPRPIYQDVIVDNKVAIKGLNLCDKRYNMIKPIFASLNKPFSVLDLGAAQGYFSFRLAYDFPKSHFTMIDENSQDYKYHGDLLLDLCQINGLNNVTYLRKRMSYNNLCFLADQEHFDVVLAFLVVHQMADTLATQQMFIERILSLGNHVIIEVADDVAVDLTRFIETLAKNSGAKYLGEVPRFQDPRYAGKGRLYWFKNDKKPSNTKVSSKTFNTLNGVYPSASLA